MENGGKSFFDRVEYHALQQSTYTVCRGDWLTWTQALGTSLKKRPFSSVIELLVGPMERSSQSLLPLSLLKGLSLFFSLEDLRQVNLSFAFFTGHLSSRCQNLSSSSAFPRRASPPEEFTSTASPFDSKKNKEYKCIRCVCNTMCETWNTHF